MLVRLAVTFVVVSLISSTPISLLQFLNTYHSMDEINQFLSMTKTNYPNLVEIGQVGQTLLNESIPYIRVADTESAANRPIIFIEATIHAREWLATATALHLINQLASGQSDDIKKLRKEYQWYVVPVLNVDGYSYSRMPNQRLHRKNLHKSDSKHCSDIEIGIDLNRNFPFHWSGAVTDVCSNIYPGTGPWSEPETNSFGRFVHHLNQQFGIRAYFALHCYSQLWLLPFGYTGEYAKNHQEMLRVAKCGALALYKVHGTQFKIGTSWDILYNSTGTSRDWAKGEGIDYVYTLELRPASAQAGGFVMPDSEIEPTAQETIAGIVAAVKSIADNSTHCQFPVEGGMANSNHYSALLIMLSLYLVIEFQP